MWIQRPGIVTSGWQNLGFESTETCTYRGVLPCFQQPPQLRGKQPRSDHAVRLCRCDDNWVDVATGKIPSSHSKPCLQETLDKFQLTDFMLDGSHRPERVSLQVTAAPLGLSLGTVSLGLMTPAVDACGGLIHRWCRFLRCPP